MRNRPAENLASNAGFYLFVGMAKFLIIAGATAFLQDQFAFVVVCLIFVTQLYTQRVKVQISTEITDLHNSLWLDTLADRTFYKLFIEDVRDGNRPDVDQVFEAATKEALADIKSNQRENGDSQISLAGKFWLGSQTFLLNLIGYLIGYGLPVFLGLATRR